MLITLGFIVFAVVDTFALWRVHKRVQKLERR